MKFNKVRFFPVIICVFFLVTVVTPGCYSPKESQKYFLQAAKENTNLIPLYSTSLYNVYFDKYLLRCVIHSSYSWGEHGGGGGGTGIGVSVFPCDPKRIIKRIKKTD